MIDSLVLFVEIQFQRDWADQALVKSVEGYPVFVLLHQPIPEISLKSRPTSTVPCGNPKSASNCLLNASTA